MTMKKLLILTILVLGLASCGDSALDKCIDKMVEQGMSARDARIECQDMQSEARIRK